MGNSQCIVMVRGERTTLTKANDKSYSLRTTVPKGVVGHLELKEGDIILWELKINPDNKDELIVIVRPYSEKNNKKKR